MVNFDFGDRLRRARKRAGLTQEALAQRLAVGPQTVYRWEAGRARPPKARLPVIARALGVDLSLLAAGASSPATSALPESPPATRLPLYIMGHIAGTTDAEAEQIDEIEVVPRQARLADSAFVVHGNSMAPYFLDGDVVGVKRQPTAQAGQLVVALADGELTFKRYGGPVGDRGGLLLPLNPEHNPIVAEEIEIFGVYRWCMRESRDGRV